jgi:hypothetical protein
VVWEVELKIGAVYVMIGRKSDLKSSSLLGIESAESCASRGNIL